ncbi:MAG: hypothetical protein ACSLE4_08840 [Methyloceanibacter sp.]|uniref:hypothetical protein n=1 Tax=Methyloceanibacter sp. TaxID=1965321 RepID=UPI003EE14856
MRPAALWRAALAPAGTTIVGSLVYKEPATALRLFFIVTLIGSLIGLKFARPTQ